MNHTTRLAVICLVCWTVTGCCYRPRYYDPYTGMVYRGGFEHPHRQVVRQARHDYYWNDYADNGGKYVREKEPRVKREKHARRRDGREVEDGYVVDEGMYGGTMYPGGMYGDVYAGCDCCDPCPTACDQCQMTGGEMISQPYSNCPTCQSGQMMQDGGVVYEGEVMPGGAMMPQGAYVSDGAMMPQGTYIPDGAIVSGDSFPVDGATIYGDSMSYPQGVVTNPSCPTCQPELTVPSGPVPDASSVPMPNFNSGSSAPQEPQPAPPAEEEDPNVAPPAPKLDATSGLTVPRDSRAVQWVPTRM